MRLLSERDSYLQQPSLITDTKHVPRPAEKTAPPAGSAAPHAGKAASMGGKTASVAGKTAPHAGEAAPLGGTRRLRISPLIQSGVENKVVEEGKQKIIPHSREAQSNG